MTIYKDWDCNSEIQYKFKNPIIFNIHNAIYKLTEITHLATYTSKSIYDNYTFNYTPLDTDHINAKLHFKSIVRRDVRNKEIQNAEITEIVRSQKLYSCIYANEYQYFRENYETVVRQIINSIENTEKELFCCVENQQGFCSKYFGNKYTDDEFKKTLNDMEKALNSWMYIKENKIK